MKKQPKTNAIRILEKQNIPFEAIYYESHGFMDGVSVANKLGQNPAQVFKTLVTVGKSREHYVFVIPVAEDLDLKAAAACVGEKSVEMIHVKDITAVTGYIRGGCSPIGMKKQFKTVVDQSALGFDQIVFSGGQLGVQIKMRPTDLQNIGNVTFHPVCKAEP